MQGNEDKNTGQNATQSGGATGAGSTGQAGTSGLGTKAGDQAKQGQQAEGGQPSQTAQSGQSGQANQSSQPKPGEQGKQGGLDKQNAGGMTGQSSTGSTGGNKGEGSVSDAATDMVSKAKETAGGLYEKAADGASTMLSDKKADLTTGLTGVAETVRRVSEAITGGEGEAEGLRGSASQYVETAASKLEGVAEYFDETDLRGLANDAQTYARRNPAVFLGGAFVVGLLAARFLKSRPTSADSQGAGRVSANTKTAETGTSKSATAGGSAGATAI